MIDRSWRMLFTAVPRLPILPVLFFWLACVSPAAAQQHPTDLTWGLTSGNTLVRFRLSAPTTIIATIPVSGLLAGDDLAGIDVSAIGGALIGVGTSGRLYTIDRQTGAATPLNPGATPTALNGSAFGIVDWGTHMRVVSDTDQHLLIDKATGAATGLPAITPSADLAGLASWIGGLVAIDPTDDALYRVDPDTSVRTRVGPLGVDTSAVLGFDISHRGLGGYAVLTVAGMSLLYNIDLVSGKATLLGGPVSVPILSLTLDMQTTPIVTPCETTVTEANTTLSFQVQRTGDTTEARDYSFGIQGANPAATPDADFVPGPEQRLSQSRRCAW